ncbi:YhgE/Pip domain-containing protein [Corynebacterium sp. zg254]|uniref:YhgE/Pip domain-containing protein n=1 Tax=Corynebacterium zhongnanshanii TaxID=2768834 RepID=A0ABQ6VJ09_9CORY|nr:MULTISPECIES: YhgE/Pip domain-containing protein [Corynebacterium]KAB3523086.1 YhgE/Pip domain-containing protein [Corynebacterium zhongnanshanii]MCR5913818.1 YhgE/Pip domain-containing protein [Corynebacterium sp. zg254]
MKHALEVFRTDLRHARNSVMASIVLFGLVVIPLLFTWFNVLATLNPFDNTSHLKVAVASKDTGYTSDIVPIPLNVGEKVLSTLRANDRLDWVVTDPEDALDGAHSGEYYAAIILPESFSSDMMTFYTGGSHSTDITLYTNEKKNPLAPKITDQGAEGVSSQIAESFSHTLGEVSLSLVSNLNEFVQSGDTQQALDRVEQRTASTQQQLASSARTARSLSDLVGSTAPLLDSAQAILNRPTPEIPPAADPINVPTDALDAALTRTAESYSAVRDRVADLQRTADSARQTRGEALTVVADQVRDNVDAFRRVRDSLDAALNLTNGQPAGQIIGELDRAIAAQEAVEARLRAAVPRGEISKPELDSLDSARDSIAALRESDLRAKVQQLQDSLGNLRGTLSGLDTSVDLNTDGLRRAQDSAASLAETLEGHANTLGDLRREISRARNTGDFSKLSQLAGADPEALATALAAPVGVDRQAVYPVPSFGAGMAPLYTTLALWVGALLCAVFLRTDASVGAERPIATYFGRFGIFALLGAAQSTLVSLGLLFFVQIEPAHPVLLVLASWVVSAVFMFLVYALVAALANAGKALAVLLLVIQISSSGGAYPLQLLPEWFQNISPWLPATYAIRAYRAAIAGTYHGDYWLSLLALLAFVLPALLLGTVLRKPLAAYTTKLNSALESTKLM